MVVEDSQDKDDDNLVAVQVDEIVVKAPSVVGVENFSQPIFLRYY